jgi:hypothetical protein
MLKYARAQLDIGKNSHQGDPPVELSLKYSSYLAAFPDLSGGCCRTMQGKVTGFITEDMVDRICNAQGEC